MKKSTSLRATFLALPFVFASACGDEPEEPAVSAVDSELTDAPLRTMEVEGDAMFLAEAARGARVVRFYEAEPGHILEVERGIASEMAAEPREPGGLNSVQRYAHLTGREPPAALSAAQKRANNAALKNDDGHYSVDVTPEFAFTAARTNNEKGGTSPRPAPGGQAWFRGEYCKQTDRPAIGFDLSYPVEVSLNGINYRRIGVYMSSGNTIHVLLWYTTGSDAFGRTYKVEGDLWPGWYIASSESSTRNALIADFVSDVESWVDFYDYCSNFHY